ncbi:uncharacterized protein ARMOST_02577 [Armillaria ostoyae]|uniref:Uncharacterized protein n=1 Tax=Armillaria ostoyae TaxID=47428 RepID=A0A284QS43_ARMOS|nr:uncharacterized protein ARMOST_02577 [Armillaria ostoyae]
MGIRDAIGKLSAAELFSSRTAIPKVKQAMKKSLNGKVFMQKVGRSARNKAKQVHCTWTVFYHTQVKDGNPYDIPEKISPESAMPPCGKSITLHIPAYTHLIPSQLCRICSLLGSVYRRSARPLSCQEYNPRFVCQVCSIWRREALRTVTPDVHQQVLTYIDSEDLKEIAPLSTDEREKFYLGATDFEIMAHGIFKDTEGFRTARIEALMWRDHEFHVLPNPGDPHSPITDTHQNTPAQGTSQKYRYLQRVPSHARDTLSHPFPVSLIITMAIEDNIFPHIKTTNDVFHPRNPPTAHHK